MTDAKAIRDAADQLANAEQALAWLEKYEAKVCAGREESDYEIRFLIHESPGEPGGYDAATVIVSKLWNLLPVAMPHAIEDRRNTVAVLKAKIIELVNNNKES